MKVSERGTPRPPRSILDNNWLVSFIPDKGLAEWVKETFFNDQSPLYNQDHDHLRDAHIGFLWTTALNTSKGRQVLGTAEEPVFRCGKWQKARQELQIYEWFGSIPDFIITLDANYCDACGEVELMALIEHELFHCAQAVDGSGFPKFNKETGMPSYTLRGHDVEEFIGVVRRYGVGEPDSQLAQLVNAAKRKPEISKINISMACGTCLAKS